MAGNTEIEVKFPSSFVILTHYDDGVPVFVNRHKVEYVHDEKLSDDGHERATVICFDGGMLFVKESPQVVVALLENPIEK